VLLGSSQDVQRSLKLIPGVVLSAADFGLDDQRRRESRPSEDVIDDGSAEAQDSEEEESARDE
jgi:hypothetical protein